MAYFERIKRIDAGASVDVGAITDVESTGNGSVISILKRIRTLLGSLTSPPSDGFKYGSVSISPSATGTVLSFVTTGNTIISGFEATGEGDGRFFLEIDGSTTMSGKINVNQPTILISSKSGILVDSGLTVSLKVTSLALGTALFEGAIMIG